MPTVRSWLRRRLGRPAARPVRRLAILSLEDRITPLGELLHTLTAPSGAVLDGTSVAATSQYVVVGAPNVTFNPGSAAVYDANSGVRLWTFTNPTASNGDSFGQAVAVGGNYVVVGAPGDNTSGTATGRAYVYDATTGNLVSTLVNPDPDPGQNPAEGFGDAVAISGTTVFVAADYDPHPALYSGNVYEFDAVTGNYLGMITPPASAQSNNFGAALAVSGNLLAISASTAGATASGQVYVYNPSASLAVPLTTVDEPGPSPAALDDFGRSLALDGTTLVVGAPKRDLSGNTDVGAAYVFNVPAAGGPPTLQVTLNNPHPDNIGEWFGHGVGISNGGIVVGSPYDDTHGQYNGQAYLFNATNGSLLANVSNPASSGNVHFGWSATAAADKLVVGADGADSAFTFQGPAPTGPPTVTINQGSTQSDPTNSTGIKFDVVFGHAVVGFDGSKVDLTGSTATGALTASVTGAGPAYTVTVSGMTGPGTVTAKIDAGVVTDAGGNGNLASTSTDNTVTFDNVAPTVTIDQAGGQADPTNASPISFTVHFSKPVTGFTGSDVNTSTSTAGGTLVPNVSGSGTDYTVTVSGMTTPGTVVASIPANAATDVAGNGNTASTSTDNSVLFDHVGTVQLSAASYSVVESAGTITVTVTRTGGSANALNVQYTTVGGTAVAGTDYTTTSGTLNWANGETTSKSFSVPILNDGAFENDKTLSVNLSNINVPGALGSPASATVTIDESAVFGFSAAGYTVNEIDGSATITVKRQFGTRGAVSVDYATSNGTATAGSDYTATTGTLSWADGDSADKTFTVPIVDDAISDGRETIHLTLSNPTGNAQLGTVATSILTIAHSNGLPAGTFFTDSDGDVVTVKLSGPGLLTYFLTDGTGPISEIDLSATDPSKSVVSITVKKPKGGAGDGRVGLGEIDGSGVKSLALGKADLIGAGINLTGFLGALSIGAIQNGADITAVGVPPKLGLATRISAGVIANGTDIAISGAPLGSLTATSIGVGTITAASIGSINIKGKAKTKTAPATPGDFKSNLTIAGTGLAAKVPALKSLKVAGTVFGCTISVAGDVGSVSVGSFVNSQLLAGYTGAVDGSGSFNLPSTVGPFTVRGTTTAFSRSFVIASNFKNVSVASVDPNNSGTKFGFIYNALLKALSVKSTGFKYDPSGPAEQDMPSSDFYVKKV